MHLGHLRKSDRFVSWFVAIVAVHLQLNVLLIAATHFLNPFLHLSEVFIEVVPDKFLTLVYCEFRVVFGLLRTMELVGLRLD